MYMYIYIIFIYVLNINYQEKYDLDYLVGSVHHVDGIPIDFSKDLYNKALSTKENSFEELAISYFDHQYKIMTDLEPKVIGHFDLIRMYKPEEVTSSRVIEYIERNIKYAISYGALFEINSRALKKGLPFPYPFEGLYYRMQL